ncbi:hypothetical protein BHE74_00036122 [Ensete ventricosum]|nr:hypothetical protein BHE74_00036122 [Ensete ventricosum]
MVEAAGKRRRGQQGPVRVATAGEQQGPARKRLGSAGGRRNGSAGSVGVAGDNNKGLVDGDSGRGWAIAADSWPTIDEERKKGRDVEDNSRADGGEEATVGGRGEDAVGSEGRKMRQLCFFLMIAPTEEEEESSNRQQEGQTRLQEKLTKFQVRKFTRPTVTIARGGGADAGDIAEEAVPKRERRPPME